MIVQFLKVSDTQLSMIVDNNEVEDSIPYLPARAVDHRGYTLYSFCKYNNIKEKEVKLHEDTENPSEVWRGFHYMKNPIHIAEAIEERKTMTYEKKQKK